MANVPTRPSETWRISRCPGGAKSSRTSALQAELTDSSECRLTELLTRIYGHPVSLQLDVDPELLGGLTIAVGDEVIDGSLCLQARRGRDPFARLTRYQRPTTK